jgi:hypothetical protein
MSYSYRQQNHQILASFFRSLAHLDPWWVSIVSPVNGDQSTTLTSVLGFEHQVGLDFLAGTGLLKLGNPSYCVVQAEWEKFLLEHNLQDIMETDNRSSVMHSKHYFINYGNKAKLSHCPIDQYDTKGQIKARPLIIIVQQQKFHRQVSKALVSAHLYEKLSADANEDGEEMEDVILDNKGEMQPDFDNVTLNEDNFPVLSSLVSANEKVRARQLHAIFRELLVHLASSHQIDWLHRNGRKARAVIIPQVRDKASFMREAWKEKWVESILEHVAGGLENHDKEDAAEWLKYYLGKKYDASFILASEALGLPLVQRLDEASTEAMWSDANINVVQQRIIRRHLKYHFGKRMFLPQMILRADRDLYEVETHYGSYKHYKNGDQTQKPEKCPYWHRDASVVVKNELIKLLDYTDPKEITNKFSSLNNSTCTLVSGADQGQGAWRSWVKISTMSGPEVRMKMANDDGFNVKDSYITSQIAHITCKKDHHEILSKTVSESISVGYEKLQSSMLIFIKAPTSNSKVKALYLTNHAENICLEKNAGDETCQLTYMISSQNENGFSMKHLDEEQFEIGSEIVLTIREFSIFIIGDLAF